MSHKNWIYMVFSGIVLSVLLLVAGCASQPPLRIGFTAELSGKQSELSTHLRNGVELAVEEINAAGGIRGRQIELLIEDDLGTPEGAFAAENKLIDAGVLAIIGHFTSNQTLAGYEVAKERNTVLLSATASSSVLSGKEDTFFRTVISTDTLGKGFAAYIAGKRNLKKIAIIFDKDNNTYSDPLIESFSQKFDAMGGEITVKVDFSDAETPDFSPLVDRLQESNPDGVFIVASPPTSGMIAQTISLTGWNPPLFAASWAQGDALIQNGGQAVEGMEIIIAFDVNDPSPELARFKKDYQARYARSPVFSAMEGYETMRLLAAALEKSAGNAGQLTSALTKLNDFKGLTGVIRIDEFGDAIRPLYILQVRQRAFETVEILEPGE